MAIKDILSEVLLEVKPSKEEEKALMLKVNEFIKKLQSKFGKEKVKVILGGSGAKGTWLKNTFDIDIFVQFPKSYQNRDISGILEKQLKNAERFHGSRDYFQVKEENFVYEIVPVIEIKNAKDALNITDVSPLHSIWVKKNSNEKTKDEIRIAKKFFKANNLYGAESYVKGFSGYVLEILTIYYGGFAKLLKAAIKWKEKQVIQVKKVHKDVFFELNSSKLVSPVILIDPVQPGRNAAAALSLEKFWELKKIAKDFLEKPSKKFFEKKEADIEKMRKEGMVIEAVPFEGKKDIIGCKIEKAFEFISSQLSKHDFEIKKQGWEWDKNAVFYYSLKEKQLDSTQIVEGPPERIKYHAEQFRKKYSDVFVKDGSIFARIKREIRTPEQLLSVIKDDAYLKDKIKSMRVL